MTRLADPFASSPPPEVPLPAAPLVRVIAQVRFPTIAAISQTDFVAPLQQALQTRFPILRSEMGQTLVVGVHGIASAGSHTVWRFHDVEKRWRLSLAPDFLSLEAMAYPSRDEFFSAFRDALTVLKERVHLPVLDRLGVRYINRITGEQLKCLSDLVWPDVLGIAGTDFSSTMSHSLTETSFALSDAQLIARWGVLPPNATVDPAAIEPIEERSWILDLDMFSATTRPFDVALAIEDARSFSARIYTFFRWSVRDEFLVRFGGQL